MSIQKSFILIALFAFAFVSAAIAQNNIGIGTINPNAKALLDLSANDKGFLVPRLTSAERLAINPTGNADAALLVYDTNDNLFYFWDGTQWVGFPQTGGSNNIALNFDANTGTLSLTDAGGTLTTNIPPDNDSDPTNELITNVVFGAGNILTIEEGGNTWSTTINVNDADSDPTNEVQQLTLNGNTLNLSISNNNINLSPYLDNTDNQTLSLTGNTLAISNGNSVNLSQYVNTDNQTLTLTGNTLAISNGNSVDLSPFAGDWKLLGNAGTNPATNFLGTTDNQPLVFRTNNTEKVRVLANGNVGIGIPNPNAPLHILTTGGAVGTISSKLVQLTNSNFSWDLRVGGGNGWLAWVPDVASNRRWQINNETGTTIFNVNVGAPENSLFMAATGHIEFGLGAGTTRRINLPNIAANEGRGRAETWETYSDGRIKSNQRIIKYGLADVLKMQPKSYDHHNSIFTENGIEILEEKNNRIGFIAQEMYAIIPEVVSKPENEASDLWSMSYEKLVPVLVKAIQEQQEIITALQKENIATKSALSEIKQLLIDSRLLSNK
jgi:hypothetical protein